MVNLILKIPSLGSNARTEEEKIIGSRDWIFPSLMGFPIHPRSLNGDIFCTRVYIYNYKAEHRISNDSRKFLKEVSVLQVEFVRSEVSTEK